MVQARRSGVLKEEKWPNPRERCNGENGERNTAEKICEDYKVVVMEDVKRNVRAATAQATLNETKLAVYLNVSV